MNAVALVALAALVPGLTPTERAAGVPKAGAVQAFQIQTPTELKLKNGMRVVYLERHRAPLVDVIAVVDAGALFDDQGKEGAAAYTAAMLTEGAGDKDAIAFADATKAIAAEVYGYAQNDYAMVGLHVGTDHFADGAKLFASALTQPRFADADWKRIQKNTFGNMMYMAQDPDSLAMLAGERAVWGKDNRLGTDVGGTPKTLVAISSAELKAFHQAHYRPDTTTLVVVGDVDKATLTKTLNDALGGWTAPPGAPPARPKTAPPLAGNARSVVEVNLPGAQQTVVTAYNPIPSDTPRYDPGVNVMNSIVGGSFSSRLNMSLREKYHYTYGAHSRFRIEKSGAYFQAGASVDTPNTGKAVAELWKQLESLKADPPADAEVTRAHNDQALSFPSMFSSDRGVASVWADIVANNIDPKRVKTFMDGALKIDAKAVNALSAKLIKPEAATLVAVGDMGAVGNDLKGVGAVTTLTVDDLLPGLREAAAALGAGQ